MGRFDERWVDEEAGPIVRSYAVVRGRTQPRGIALDLVTLLCATGRQPPHDMRLSREETRMLALCWQPAAVVDLASDLDLPLGVVKVIAGEMCHRGLLEVRKPARQMVQADQALLQRVLEDLKAL